MVGGLSLPVRHIPGPQVPSPPFLLTEKLKCLALCRLMSTSVPLYTLGWLGFDEMPTQLPPNIPLLSTHFSVLSLPSQPASPCPRIPAGEPSQASVLRALGYCLHFSFSLHAHMSDPISGQVTPKFPFGNPVCGITKEGQNVSLTEPKTSIFGFWHGKTAHLTPPWA